MQRSFSQDGFDVVYEEKFDGVDVNIDGYHLLFIEEAKLSDIDMDCLTSHVMSKGYDGDYISPWYQSPTFTKEDFNV